MRLFHFTRYRLQFFDSQVWCDKSTPERERLLLLINPHSPLRLRVNVPMRNFDKFSYAFKCKAGDGMFLAPKDRCQLW